MNIVRYGVVAVAVVLMSDRVSIANAADREHDAGIHSTDDPQAHHREAMRIEREYRQRIARLERLRDLAEQSNAEDRLAELDRLYDRLRSEHAGRLSEIRRHLKEPSRRELDAALAADRDQEAWVREHQDKAQELWEEHRGAGHAQVSREHRADGRKTDPGRRAVDHETHRDDRAGHRAVGETHRSGHRETRRERHRNHHREIRGNAQERAEQRWLDARGDAGTTVHTARHMNYAASRLADKRWREEARDHSSQRWERAARRSGILDGVPPSRRPAQRESDVDSRSRISQENADREFERLLREVGKK